LLTSKAATLEVRWEKWRNRAESRIKRGVEGDELHKGREVAQMAGPSKLFSQCFNASP
jgi:hypothetical protein